MKLTTEIAIIGAGPAGVTAAISAARLGKNVVLVGNRPVLGGNSSSEIRVWTRGATGAGNLFSEEMGIWGELKLKNLYANLDGNPVFWSEILLDAVLAEENITLFLNTYVDSACMKGNQLASVSAYQMGTEKRFEISAEMFLDCTGDGSIGALVGVPFLRGKESAADFGESFAQQKASEETQGNSLLYYVKDVGHPVKFAAPDYAYDMSHIERLIGSGGRIVSPQFSGSDYWWFEYGGKKDTIADAQEISIELKRLVMGVWNYIKNSGKFEAETLTLEWFGSLPGKRESRRMRTDYILTQNDIVEQRKFDDGAFYGGWYIDFHPSDGMYADKTSCDQLPVSVYQLPLRCLYNSEVPNLLFAGRNIGASHVAFASSRIMNTCALSGQAAAVLAAECINSSCVPKQVNTKAVQQTLLRQDMFIPGVTAQDEQDIAPNAIIKATSVFSGAAESPSESYSLAQGAFIVLPQVPDGEYALLLQAEKDTTLTMALFYADVPSRLCSGTAYATYELPVLQGNHVATLQLPQPPEKGFLFLEIAANEAVQVRTAQRQTPGIIMGHPDKPDYHFPCAALDGASLYAAENVVNGTSRPYATPNCWVSQDGESRLTLTWDDEKHIQSVEITLDPDLSMEIPSSRAGFWSDEHKFVARSGMPPQLAKDIFVWGITPLGERKILAEIKNNWRRKLCVSVDSTIACKAIELEFASDYGANRATVYEVRVYEQQ